jgi:hypothetical protein
MTRISFLSIESTSKIKRKLLQKGTWNKPKVRKNLPVLPIKVMV